MALNLSSAIIAEKNKLAGAGAWLVLLEIQFPGETAIRLVANTEDITWDGETWTAFPFEIDQVSEDGKGGLPSFSIKVSNVTRSLVSLVEQYSGGVGSTAILRVVHSDLLADVADVTFEESYSIISCSVDILWVIFTLGAENPMRQRTPKQRYLQDHCRFKIFKGDLCGYGGAESECDRTFSRCKELGNQARFGGFPSIGLGQGVYV